MFSLFLIKENSFIFTLVSTGCEEFFPAVLIPAGITSNNCEGDHGSVQAPGSKGGGEKMRMP